MAPKVHGQNRLRTTYGVCAWRQGLEVSARHAILENPMSFAATQKSDFLVGLQRKTTECHVHRWRKCATPLNRAHRLRLAAGLGLKWANATMDGHGNRTLEVAFLLAVSSARGSGAVESRDEAEK